MLSLLITPLILFLISFLILDRDVAVVSRLIVCWILLDLFTWQVFGLDYFYLRAAFIDILLACTVVSFIRGVRLYFVTVPITISLFLNLYEHVSYFQTMFYPYRHYIQSILMQVMIWGLIYGCNWRKLCNKTHTQN